MHTKFKKYLFSYNHNGQNWCFEIQAESPDDAKERLSRLAFASYDGEVVAKVPASLGWPAQLVVAARNKARELFSQ